MQDVFNSVLPVATLLLGAGLANFLKLSELRKSLRLDAADQLGEIPALLWNKSDRDGWLKMNAAVSRLVIRLSLAGIHPDLIARVRASALGFWNSVHEVGDDEQGEIWSVGDAANEEWTEASLVVAELLGVNSAIKSWRIGRRVRRQLRKWDEADQAMLASAGAAGQ